MGFPPYGRNDIQAYCSGAHIPRDFPFHAVCGAQWYMATSSKPWSLDLLDRTLTQLSGWVPPYGPEGDAADTRWDGWGPKVLRLYKVDYGVAEAFMGDTHKLESGFEDLYTRPCSNPDLTMFYDYIVGQASPEEEAALNVSAPLIPSTKWSTDPFRKLGPDLLRILVDMLEVTDLRHLRRVSCPFARLELPPTFWKARLQQDMPFLYDFVVPDHLCLNWQYVYQALDFVSSRSKTLDRQREAEVQNGATEAGPADPYRHLAIRNLNLVNSTLINRRRIWRAIDQIIENASTEEWSLEPLGWTVPYEPFRTDW